MDTFFRILRSSPVKRAPGGILGGVAAGLAVTFNWPVSYVRIGMLLSFLLPVVGLPMYGIAWLLLPKTDGTIALERLMARG
jgi:phage shock protein PspC (stress-responsive transcriptional regulator)